MLSYLLAFEVGLYIEFDYVDIKETLSFLGRASESAKLHRFSANRYH